MAMSSYGGIKTSLKVSASRGGTNDPTVTRTYTGLNVWGSDSRSEETTPSGVEPAQLGAKFGDVCELFDNTYDALSQLTSRKFYAVNEQEFRYD